MEVMGKPKTWLGEFFNRLMGRDRRQNLQNILLEAAKWRPDAANYSYADEMANRIDYYRGAMQKDMKTELERRFPQTHDKIEKEQVNLALVKKEINDKAKCFMNSGEIYLVNEKGERIEGDAQDRFSELMRESMAWSCFKQADAYTQLCHRAAFKPWWDSKAEQVRISIWAPHQVFIVPNPHRWWDVDSAYCVLFEMPGVDGISSSVLRYEVWGVRDTEAAKITQQQTVHFTTDGENDYQINSEDVNPFKDPRSGEPIYPFTWWQDDASTDLYTVGYEDMLTVNRAVNSSLTDVRRAMHFKAFGMLVHTMGPGAVEFGRKTLDPGVVIDIADGCNLSNLATDFPVTDMWNFNEKLADANAMLNGLPSTAMRRDAGSPESGYALAIRNRPLMEHREEMLGYMLPVAEESAYRIAIVHNAYSDEPINGLESLRVKIEPGELQIEEDPEAEGRRYAAEISSDVSTAADWRMARYNESKEEAEAAVEENAAKNQERAKSKFQGQQFGGGMADQFANQIEREQEEPEEEEEPEQEE